MRARRERIPALLKESKDLKEAEEKIKALLNR